MWPREGSRRHSWLTNAPASLPIMVYDRFRIGFQNARSKKDYRESLRQIQFEITGEVHDSCLKFTEIQPSILNVKIEVQKSPKQNNVTFQDFKSIMEAKR